MPENNSSIILDNDESLSEDVQDIINYRPHWIVRKSNGFFFIFLFILIAVMWLIKYPDTVTGTARLRAIEAPRQINSKIDGRLVKLLVNNEQVVEKGHYLAFLQSTAQHQQVINLQKWITGLIQLPESQRIQAIAKDPLPDFVSLGELQFDYQQFYGTLSDTKQILANGYYKQKERALNRDLTSLAILQNNTIEQQKLVRNDYELQKTEYTAKEYLLKEKVIAPLEFNEDKSKLIAKEQNLQRIQNQLIGNQISLQNKQREILDLNKTVLDKVEQFSSALLSFNSKIDDWIEKYIVSATDDGRVFFASTLEENQLITSNQELFYIQPKQTGYYSELMVSQKGLGKVVPGQHVIIRLESFPASEFGHISGVVRYIANIPNRRDSFLVKVELPNGLKTNYDQTIFFRNGLSGNGEIVTSEKRMLQRLLVAL